MKAASAMTPIRILAPTAFLVMTGVVLGFALMSQEPLAADASCSGMLKCNAEATAGVWGHGATCSEALQDFQQQANAKVPGLRADCDSNYCGVCNVPPIFYNQPCIDSGGQKQVDGTVSVRCLEEPFGDPGPM